MKAMFLKELRENLKWGLLILGFFCLSVAGWIHEAGPNLLFDMVRPETTGVPLAVVGLALGLLQTWFETRPTILRSSCIGRRRDGRFLSPKARRGCC